MAQAFAITTLHVCRKKPTMSPEGRVLTPPEIEVVPAGSIVDVSDDDFKAFEKAGAVRRPTKVDRAMADEDDEPDQVEAAAGKATAATTKAVR